MFINSVPHTLLVFELLLTSPPGTDIYIYSIYIYIYTVYIYIYIYIYTACPIDAGKLGLSPSSDVIVALAALVRRPGDAS